MVTPPNKRTGHAKEQQKSGDTGVINTQWKEGEVVEVDAANAKARVEFSDQENSDGSNFTSPFYRVMQRGTLGSLAYWMPKVGEQVLCLVDPNQEDGVIVGSTYNEQDPPPKSDNSIYHYKFSDGSTITYDEGAGTLSLNIQSDITITVGGKVTIDCSEESTINGKSINVLGAVDDDTESNGNNSITDSNQL